MAKDKKEIKKDILDMYEIRKKKRRFRIIPKSPYLFILNG